MNKINWKAETPIRLQNCLINEFGSEFDLNNKADRLAAREKRLIMRIPNFGRKSWKYLENYLLTRWPDDSDKNTDATFNISRRFDSRKDKGKRNFQIWIDRQKGMTFAEIAKKNRISNERVRQINCKIERKTKYFLPKYEKFVSVYFKIHNRYIGQPHHEDRNLKIWGDAAKGLTYKKIAKKYKLNCTTVRDIYLRIEANKRLNAELMEDFKESIFFKDIIN